MLLIKLVGIPLKLELNEQAITSGSLTILFNGGARWLVVFTKNGVDVGPHALSYCFQKNSQENYDNTASGSSGYFSE